MAGGDEDVGGGMDADTGSPGALTRDDVAALARIDRADVASTAALEGMAASSKEAGSAPAPASGEGVASMGMGGS